MVSEIFSKMEVFLHHAPVNPEKIIAYNYFECIEDRKLNSVYQIDDKVAEDVAKWVFEGGHTPAIESINLGFTIRGISRITSHQLVRHRIGVSIGQRTQRANSEEYLGMFANGGHFILPPSINKLYNESPFFHQSLMYYLESAQNLYNHMLETGISEDDARYIIPHCAETSMTFNVNLKSLMDSVCSTRLCHLMQGETVEVVRLMAMCVKEWNPFIGSYLKPYCLKSGKCNRNENNPTDDYPLGVCLKTLHGEIPPRKKNDTFNLTKYSQDVDTK